MESSAKWYGALNKVELPIAKKALTFYDRSTLNFGPILEYDQVVKQAVEGKFLSAPLTSEQAKDLIDIVYTTPKK
jgi:hypothetical protein